MFKNVLMTLIALLAVTAASGGAAAAAIVAPAPAAATNAQSTLIALVNSYRAANGLQQVGANGSLNAAAAWMATDMATNNYFSHTSRDGRSSMQRMAAFGYPAASMYTGENIAGGYADPAAVIAGWKASPGHNAVLLNPNYNAIGIGLAYSAGSAYKWYWVADFGGPGVVARAAVAPAPVAPVYVAPAPAPVRAAPAPRAAAPPSAPVEEAAAEPAPAEPTAEEIAAAARAARDDARALRRITHLLKVLELHGGI